MIAKYYHYIQLFYFALDYGGGGNMLLLDEMKRIRTEKNMSYEEIAIKSGVSIYSDSYIS